MGGVFFDFIIYMYVIGDVVLILLKEIVEGDWVKYDVVDWIIVMKNNVVLIYDDNVLCGMCLDMDLDSGCSIFKSGK